MTTAPFSVEIDVRHYELDTQGHVNSATYLLYAEHARWQHLASLGIDRDALAARGVGPVFLEVVVRYERELRSGDRVRITSELNHPDRPATTFFVEQSLTRTDGTPVATIRSTAGLLDLQTRRLIHDPRALLLDLGRRARSVSPATAPTPTHGVPRAI